ncbi:MAG: amino acid ABC transporter permease [Acidimicrobiia bacterium]
MTAPPRAPDHPAGPPVLERHPLTWVRKNLFSTPLDIILTVLFGGLIVAALVWLTRYLLSADPTILRVNLANLMVGRFPRDQLWRPGTAAVMLGFVVGGGIGLFSALPGAEAPSTPSGPANILRRFWPLLAFVVLVLSLTETITPWFVALGTIAAGVVGYLARRAVPQNGRRRAWAVLAVVFAGAYVVLSGGGVGWNQWGGLHLNLFLTVAGILLAFPFGLLLALGRRSTFPAIRTASIGYIEFIRGVPLITLLLLGAFALGFFLPDTLSPGRITRILIAIALFEAAYIAEVVRGGFNAVPKGQVEASQALGMPPWKTTRLIVLPQALRATIPAMVGQFISLYKDTTLVVVVGLLDILSASQAANSQPEFLAQGLHRITLPFVGLAFWVGSYTMSREARRLERKLGVGER